MRALRASTALAVVLVAVPAAPATIAAGGLYGVVRKGPVAPVCRAGIACDAPAQVTLVFSRGGAEVARTRSTAAGRYRVRLAAGFYSVRTLERVGISRDITPRKVHVRAGRVDRLDFSIDTGIR